MLDETLTPAGSAKEEEEEVGEFEPCNSTSPTLVDDPDREPS